jgi:hypothetical protein
MKKAVSTRPRVFRVMDYETICNCFVGVFINHHTDEMQVFVVHVLRNDWPAFLDFLEENAREGDWHFGYNNIAFDAQVSEHILKDIRYYRSLTDPNEITRSIYGFAQDTINRMRDGEFPQFAERHFKIRVHDIFKMNHWDNQAKQSSLKWIQFSMDWPNVEEMPHPHHQPVKDYKTLSQVVNYCINDVRSTQGIYRFQNAKGEYVMEGQINMRATLSRKYGVNLLSASETRISKEIFLYYLAEKLGWAKQDIRGMGTRRELVDVGQVILPYVKFETPEFRGMLTWFQHMQVDVRQAELDEKKKKGPKYSMLHKGVTTDYGLGGLHGCARSGVYTAGPDPLTGKRRIIKSADVVSYYPNLAIRNRWSPAHIPQETFCELYEWFFEERKTYPKKDPLNYTFKIVLNATYGLSKNRHSFLYDPEFTFRITINGQLLLSMLYEMLSTRLPGSVPLMQNTDGLEFIIDEDQEGLFQQICKEWEEMTMLQLEYVNYEKMIIGDVNNYIAVWQEEGKQKTKCKGRFEFEELALHKNKSFQVIPKALYAYFMEGVLPEDFVKGNTHIHDYCAGVKARGESYFEEVTMVHEAPAHLKLLPTHEKINMLLEAGWRESWGKENWVHESWSNQEANAGLTTEEAFRQVVGSQVGFHTKRLQKIVRYYVSRTGAKLVRTNANGQKVQLQAGKWKQTTMNDYIERPFADYNLDLEFYLKAIREEIRKIEQGGRTPKEVIKETQLSLF